jgi:hypothetical protein
MLTATSGDEEDFPVDPELLDYYENDGFICEPNEYEIDPQYGRSNCFPY